MKQLIHDFLARASGWHTARTLGNACSLTKQAIRLIPLSDFLYGLNVSERHQYAYIDNPKTGCSSLKSALIELEFQGAGDGRNPYDWNIIHNPQLSPLQAFRESNPPITLSELINRNYRFFTFVRNPYTRVLSAYKNRILLNQIQKKKVTERLGFKEHVDNPDISFEQFVDVIVGQTDFEMDPHWRVQTTQVLFNLIPYRYIGRFESYSDSYYRAFEMLGIDRNTVPEIRHLSSTKGQESRCSDWYSTAIQEKVLERYRPDFLNFGYDTDLPN